MPTVAFSGTSDAPGDALAIKVDEPTTETAPSGTTAGRSVEDRPAGGADARCSAGLFGSPGPQAHPLKVREIETVADNQVVR